MSLARLWTRLLRVEQQASQLPWYADVLPFFDTVVRQAGTAIGLAPDVVQALRTALNARLRELGQRFPTRFTDAQGRNEMMTQVVAALREVLAVHVVDPRTRQRVQTQIGEEIRAQAEADTRAARGMRQ